MYPSSKLAKAAIIYRWINKNKSNFFRNKCSLSLWGEDISTDIKLKIEKHWSSDVISNKSSNNSSENSFYVLPMFPYPSGKLHMGHVRVYTISDTIARIHKLDGKRVIHPIGWDAFGLPAENAAIEHNIQPDDWTKSNIQYMRKQLLELAYDFNWDRELCTCDPEYYKWTQYIFLKLFEKGLAYQRKAKVNWDPVDETVLADEQVDEFGNSWRSGAKVESKTLTQWFIKTTRYAKDLYDGLSKDDLEDWKDIINLQKHWIGECDGIVVNFEIKLGNKMKAFDIWTADPYKLIYGEFIVMKPDNVILQEVELETLNGMKCFNPLTNKEIPVIITNEVDYPDGRDVYIATPSYNDNDRELAHRLNVSVIDKNKILDIAKENEIAINTAKEKNLGGYFVSSKLKDWLISRQRYWGTPIPIIHCSQCGPVGVPYEELPVTLPHLERPESGIQTLSKIDDWVNCKCPKCSSEAKRETDTMDTFVDSSWYYYRYLDPNNKNKPFNSQNVQGKVPVNIYIGGKEHAVLHLYYARFMSYFLHSLGWSPSAEPFKQLIVQGMVMGQSYKVKSTGKYIPSESVEKIDNIYKEKCTGELVSVQWEKMSKSKHNGENPERLLKAYGCDTTRLLILADVPPATSRHWSESTLPGVLNWQHRLWLTMREYLHHKNIKNTDDTPAITNAEFKKQESKIWDERNYFIATATYHFKYTNKLSVGISRLQSLTSTLRNKVAPQVIATSEEYELALAYLIIMLAPVTPHFCSELWSGFTSVHNKLSDSANIIWDKGVLEQKWPKVDDNFNLSLLCKVDGADRCELKIKAADLSKLDLASAVKIMTNEQSVVKRIKSGICKTKYEYYPGCRAILRITTNRNPIPKNTDQREEESLKQ